MLNTHHWLLDQKEDFLSDRKWQKTVNLIARIFKASAGFVVQYLPNEGFQVLIASEQAENPYPVGAKISSETNIFCKHVVQDKSVLYIKNAALDSQWDDNPEFIDDGLKSYLGLPIIRNDGSAFGTLCIMDFDETDYPEDYLELVEHLRDIIEDDLIMIDNFCKVRDMAMIDPLTSINNRRSFTLLAQQKLKLSKRMELLTAVLFIDVNDFKPLNDQYGHEVGDQVLITLANTLNNFFRDVDVVGRLGGDEFVVILHLKNSQDMEGIVSRLKKSFVSNIINAGIPNSTISIGHIIANNKQHDLEQLIDLADKKMYEDKIKRN